MHIHFLQLIQKIFDEKVKLFIHNCISYDVCTEDHMKMLQNQMDSISLDVAQISAHAKAQVKSILEVSIHMHLLGTLYTDLLHICMLLYVIMLLYVHSFLCEMHSVQYGSN